ncbi:MAG: FAD-binding oxidoreductase, partial [Calditrichaeota bacterium]|nr:FAD-binding oxidoreductase [Calditrichota bacterium]
LSGAAIAANHELVVSLQRMNRILKIDTIGMTVEVESGVILEELQNKVKEAGLDLPLDFAAKGSAQIGGCVATNAGGIKVIKHGMTRDIVLGLEVVLMNGEILNLNKKLVKDNSGYALHQLFIGSEGTLGIISKVTLKCIAAAKKKEMILMATDSFKNVPELFRRLRENNFDLLIFEFFSGKGLNLVLDHNNQLSTPFSEEYPFYMLTEIADLDDERLMDFFEKVSEAGLLMDANRAESSAEAANLLALRENISESISLTAQVHKNDISVPVAQLSNFTAKLEQLISEKYTDYELILFGHIGDGNIHVNILNSKQIGQDQFRSEMKILDNDMFALISSLGGSISAEHGIGLLKKDGLKFRRSELEIRLMKQIKAIFDPKKLLNPGKIFD